MMYWFQALWAKLQAEEGQGLVEYALILVFVSVIVVVGLMLFGPQIGNIFSGIYGNLQVAAP